MKQSILDEAKELRESGLGYKEIVESILGDYSNLKWFNNSYEGNEFDLRQELEDEIEQDLEG